jgi:hypothetical protein
LSETAQGQSIPLLEGGRGFASSTKPTDGLFYIGEAQGEDSRSRESQPPQTPAASVQTALSNARQNILLASHSSAEARIRSSTNVNQRLGVNQVAIIQSGLPQFLCVDLANQQRNGLVQIPVVDLCEQPSQDSYTESFRLNNPDELGPARIKGRKDVVVVDRQPKEAANPLPIPIWVEFGHRKFRLDSIRQVDNTFRFWPEFASRFHFNSLDMSCPARPTFYLAKTLPRHLLRNLNDKFSLNGYHGFTSSL